MWYDVVEYDMISCGFTIDEKFMSCWPIQYTSTPTFLSFLIRTDESIQYTNSNIRAQLTNK